MAKPKFRDELFYLSNMAPVPIMWYGLVWPTAEHLYQAFKTKVKKEREAIRSVKNPKQVKAMGKSVTLRDDWEKIKYERMKLVLMLKFTQSPTLMLTLKNEDPANLVEENYWHDLYWGVCVCSKHKGEGKNMLGKALTEVRQWLIDNV